MPKAVWNRRGAGRERRASNGWGPLLFPARNGNTRVPASRPYAPRALESRHPAFPRSGAMARGFYKTSFLVRRAWPALPVMLGLAGLMGLCGCSGATTSKNGLETSAHMSREKIDPALLMAIQQRELPKQPGQAIDVLIRTRSKIDAAQRAVLEGKGARIGSVLGDVLTANVPARAVSGIARLEFVMHIEMAKQQRLR